MKKLIIISSLGLVVAVPLIYVLIVYVDRNGIVMFRSGPTLYYHSSDLKSRNLPGWDLTNAIPLTPDAAVRAAMQYANKKHPGISSWDVDRIWLENNHDGNWVYDVSMIDRKSGGYASEDIRVLMDGSIWEPTTEQRKQ